jgi:hypothetical protein
MEITKDYLNEIFNYKNGGLYWKVNKSNKSKIDCLAGTLHPSGYIHIIINYKPYLAHRLIFMYHYGYFPKEVDHINGDKSDNRIENLRAATRSENIRNIKLQKNNISGSKGVYWSKAVNSWVVGVTLNYRRIHLGCYKDLELAELVAVMGREKYHGSFARNF